MIALIADIHGNFPALQAVLRQIDAHDCKQIYSLGDVAGYSCMINECIDALRERGAIHLLGNHDHYLVANVPCSRSRTANMCLDYQRREIRPDNLAWLAKSSLRLDFEEVAMVHGGWNDPLEEYLYEIRASYFAHLPSRYFFSGHTHVQVLAEWLTNAYCNPGSVGQPRDGDPRAAFALFDEGRIKLDRVAYDIDAICFEMRRAGFSQDLCRGLFGGNRFDGSSARVEIHN